MLKELSWYIETNRFTNIVEKIEEKAAAYNEALKADSDNKDELREDLRACCQWHMEKSGYKTESVPYINIDLEFFNGQEINRAALNSFEKEIIKAHMYQKHLWEFMGTTGSMTVISKTAMNHDGFDYEKYLPLEDQKTHKPKSPISKILRENPSAIPFYMYLDGSVSSEYNPNNSKLRFDVLKDKSGFDWTKKGWDPNYEVQKEGWHGEYDETGTWTMVREDNNSLKKKDYAGAKFEKVPEIEILKDGDKAILYDPNYSLISTFERIFLLTNGEIYGAEREDTEKTAALIKKAMAEIGTTSIKAVCGEKNKTVTKKLNENLFELESPKEGISAKNVSQQKKGQRITNERILSFYKKLLGESLESAAELTSYKEYRKIKKELTERTENKKIEEFGKTLSEKIALVESTGETGEKLIKAIQTDKVQMPLSVFTLSDKKETGLTDEEFNVLQNYSVPEHKKELFSRAILNMLLERETIKTSGKEVHELFDAVYADVVQGKKSDETISVETTFSELCSNPEKSLGAEPVETSTIAKLTEAKRNLPEQKTPELQKKVNAAVDNIIRNFSAVRMSTGMTPEEAVRLAAKTVGGKDSAVFVPPASGIVYQTPAMNASLSVQNGSDKRIFSDIRIADLIDKAKNLPPKTKEIEIERLIAESRQSKTTSWLSSRGQKTDTGNIHAENNGADKSYEETHKAQKTHETFPNLFNKEEREAWYKTESFMKTGLTVADIESLVYSEAEKIQGLKSSTDENVITFSKTMELDRELNYNSRRPEQSNNAIIARIEPVMRSRNTEETVRELNEKSKSAGISAEYKAAEINTNGKLSRELAGAVTQADFARERNRIIFGDAALRNSPAPKYSGKPRNIPAPPKAEKSGTEIRHSSGIAASDILAGDDTDIIGIRTSYKETTPSPADRTEAAHHSYSESESPDKEIYTAVPVNESDFHSGTENHTEDMRFNAADSIARKSFIENAPSYSSVTAVEGNDNLSMAAHTSPANTDSRNATSGSEPSYTSVQGRENGSSGKKAGRNSSQPREDISGRTKQMLTPEQEEAARLERMNANYEHDKAILAKADPMFVRNHFWDVGHAEGSGEASDREIKKAEEPENFPTFHQSARQQAQSRFLTESTEEITDSNVSKYTQDGQIFPTDYNSGTESQTL